MAVANKKADPEDKASKKDEAARWSKLRVLKDAMKKATGDYKDLQEIMETKAEWAWANNADNVGVITARIHELNSTIDSTFRGILISTSAQLKKDIGADTLLVSLSQFIAAMQPNIVALNKDRLKLLARYRAGLA